MGKLDMYDNFGIESMTGAEHAERQAYVDNSCKCRGCPTYVEGDSIAGYCFPLIGTSKAIQWEKECICGTCPIYAEYELNHNHYCTRCSQHCQSIKTLDAGSSGGN
jgi:hypothetical protein